MAAAAEVAWADLEPSVRESLSTVVEGEEYVCLEMPGVVVVVVEEEEEEEEEEDACEFQCEWVEGLPVEEAMKVVVGAQLVY